MDRISVRVCALASRLTDLCAHILDGVFEVLHRALEAVNYRLALTSDALTLHTHTHTHT